jgi:hypothetical protein
VAPAADTPKRAPGSCTTSWHKSKASRWGRIQPMHRPTFALRGSAPPPAEAPRSDGTSPPEHLHSYYWETDMTSTTHHLDTIRTTFRRSATRSPSGVLSGIAVLCAIPLAIVTNIAFGGGDRITVHIALAVGMLLLFLSTFDFRVSSSLAVIGRAGMIVLGGVFLLQAAAEVVRSPDLLDLAYANPLVQWAEKLSTYPILVWFAALWLVLPRSLNRIFGGLALAAIVANDVYFFWVLLHGGSPDSLLQALVLLLFAWLLIEGLKREH